MVRRHPLLGRQVAEHCGLLKVGASHASHPIADSSSLQEIPAFFRSLLVRTVLAQQYGIKPEEVTWKQIRSAVAELLPVYPAITLVPSPVCSGLTQGAIESNVEQKMSRRAFIEPLLKAKGWSILDWANEADVRVS